MVKSHDVQLRQLESKKYTENKIKALKAIILLNHFSQKHMYYLNITSVRDNKQKYNSLMSVLHKTAR